LKRLLAAFVLLTFATFSSSATPQAEPPRTIVKADSKVEFHANSTFAKVIGVFHSWDVNFKMPSDKFDDASIDMKIESDSVTTGSGIRDKEVKGKNFFDVKEFPEIRFVSKTITPDGGPDPTKFLMDANLTVRGITQLVSVAVVVHPAEKGHQVIDGNFSFNRRDFGMTHNVPFNKVNNIVQVQFHLVANAPPQAAQLKSENHP
jgi:polyisoprenoid-binding protein YceI